MTEVDRVARPPAKPLVVFDGDCGFCRHWIRRWQQRPSSAVDFVPYQDARVRAQFPEVPLERFEQAVQFIDTDGQIYGGAEAVFRLLSQRRLGRWLLWLYLKVPAAPWLMERCYRFVARHRATFRANARRDATC